MRKGLNRAFEIWPVTPGCRTLEPVTVLPQFRPQSQNTVSRGRVREPFGCTKKEIRLLVFVVVLVIIVIRRSLRVVHRHENIRQTYLHAGIRGLYIHARHEDGSPKLTGACTGLLADWPIVRNERIIKCTGFLPIYRFSDITHEKNVGLARRLSSTSFSTFFLGRDSRLESRRTFFQASKFIRYIGL